MMMMMMMWVKDLPKVYTWHLERNLNPRPFRRKATNLPISHHAPQIYSTSSRKTTQKHSIPQQIPPHCSKYNPATTNTTIMETNNNVILQGKLIIIVLQLLLYSNSFPSFNSFNSFPSIHSLTENHIICHHISVLNHLLSIYDGIYIALFKATIQRCSSSCFNLKACPQTADSSVRRMVTGIDCLVSKHIHCISWKQLRVISTTTDIYVNLLYARPALTVYYALQHILLVEYQNSVM